MQKVNLTRWNGRIIDHSNETDITKYFFVVTDHKMSDYGSDHGSYQQTS